jgi:hypothetical protein
MMASFRFMLRMTALLGRGDLGRLPRVKPRGYFRVPLTGLSVRARLKSRMAPAFIKIQIT